MTEKGMSFANLMRDVLGSKKTIEELREIERVLAQGLVEVRSLDKLISVQPRAANSFEVKCLD